MRQTKTDRRSLRTRQMLMAAMVDLMRLKRYDSITVQEIADRANIGRSTFYAHFTDKDDLLTDGVRRMLTAFTSDAATAAAEAQLLPSLALLRHIGAQADLYQVLARGRGLTLFMAALHDELTTLLAERLTARLSPGTTPAVPPPLLAVMIAGMLSTTIHTWVGGGLTQPAEEIDRMFRTAATAAIRAGLRSEPAPPPVNDRRARPAGVGAEPRLH